MGYNFRVVLKLLRQKGWVIKNQRGSHVQMIHPCIKEKITVPNHGKRDLSIGTLKTIWKKAGGL